MSPIEAAYLYKDVVGLYDSIPEDEPTSKDAVGSFRSQIHQLVMDTFRAQGVEFQDRNEAARIAFEMAADATIPGNDSREAAPSNEGAPLLAPEGEDAG